MAPDQAFNAQLVSLCFCSSAVNNRGSVWMIFAFVIVCTRPRRSWQFEGFTEGTASAVQEEICGTSMGESAVSV